MKIVNKRQLRKKLKSEVNLNNELCKVNTDIHKINNDNIPAIERQLLRILEELDTLKYYVKDTHKEVGRIWCYK